MSRRLCLLVAALSPAVAPGSIAAAHASADAAVARSADACHTIVQDRRHYPLDTEYRLVAWCDRLDARTKARGVLDLKFNVDDHTPWFTNLHVKHYSNWRFSPIGIPGSRIEFADR